MSRGAHTAPSGVPETVLRKPAVCSPFSWNPQAGTIECDAHVRRIWGVDPDVNFDFATFRQGVHPEDWSRVEVGIAHCLDPDGDGVYAVEYRVIGINDGVERYVQAYGGTVFVDRQPIHFTGALVEITESKGRQAHLAESERRFRLFAENSNDALWIGDARNEGFDYLSPAYERIWGERRDSFEPTFTHWAGTVHPDDRARALAWMALVHEGEAKRSNTASSAAMAPYARYAMPHSPSVIGGAESIVWAESPAMLRGRRRSRSTSSASIRNRHGA